MIGTAAIPITALSAKLITTKMKSSTTTIQARLRSSARIGPALHPPDSSRTVGERANRLGLTTCQQIESDDVRDHQQRHIEDWDRVGGAQLPRQRWKIKLDAVIVEGNSRKALWCVNN